MTTNNPELGLTSLLPRHIPTVGYTIQNILISLTTLASSAASLFFTLCFILPLSLLRAFIPRSLLIPRGRTAEVMRKNKVVLIIGASRGIGFGVLKQYVNEPDTVIIAASKSIELIRKAVIELGYTRATLQCTELDLTVPKKQVVDNLRNIDKKYGPVTHLYAVSGISTQLNGKDGNGITMDTMADMINVNISGTVASVLTMYELMKLRGYGKICVIGTIPGLSSPAKTICYKSTKSFINTFATSLRIVAAPHGVEVVTVQPGFLDARMSKSMMPGQKGPLTGATEAGRMAVEMVRAVECGGVGVVCWPVKKGVLMYGFEAVNPICEEIGKWVSMKAGMVGKGKKSS
ncbi:hypothetical protein GALMADRAFT_76617 [Galerina marginata CBS 339.88]|uniref:NAD(P)-binding protein n=1 Tax=Galerina marginata (strain CBS 339.88) TaxID=685588 RepID=A0A067SG90_GALM3|nr:hypothetical protein GALMADRAFT_76617 [Galerina marginata CBS 339.88]